MNCFKNVAFSDLLYKTIKSVDLSTDEDGGDLVTIRTVNGWEYRMYHVRDCCESVQLEDGYEDLKALEGAYILRASEVTQEDPNAQESGTWTFYKLASLSSDATLRWYGSSNGYYSESVEFEGRYTGVNDV